MQIQVNHLNIHLNTINPPTETVDTGLILIHGAGLDHRIWLPWAEQLKHIGWPIFIPDLPNHGQNKNDLSIPNIESYAQWIESLIQALPCLSHVVVGHSMGGLVALELAKQYPSWIRGVVLLSSALEMQVHPNLLEQSRDHPPSAFEKMIGWGVGPKSDHPTSLIQNARKTMLYLFQSQQPQILHADLQACTQYKGGQDALKEVFCPLLYLGGEDDRMIPKEQVDRLVHGCQGELDIHLFDHCGHATMLEKPQETAEHILDFLKGL